MAKKNTSVFTCINTEGALLPASLLEEIAAGSKGLEGLSPTTYNLAPGERAGTAIARSWSRLTGLWTAFRKHLANLPENDLATGLTRERWLMPLFDELGYGRLPLHRSVEIEGKSYPISHMHQATPVHLVGARIDLDRRVPGAVGAARTSPHSLVQEFLNRSEEHLWAVVSNGLKLRILRDNISFTRQAYVEFDLEAMFDGEVYSDFNILWLVCHATRFGGDQPGHSWMEKWSQIAQQRGARALDSLRDGVEKAITSLGVGFLARGLNPELKARLTQGNLDKQDYYRQLLRLVYRLLFLFVAEDRNLLLSEDAPPETRDRYTNWYSTARLRELSRRPRTGGRHVDLGRLLFLVFEKMQTGARELGISPLGGYLWNQTAIADLVGCDIHNSRLLAAVRSLAWTMESRVLLPVDFRNLGAEELGSVYESLLELHPEIDPEAGHFELKTAAGHERKSTGSYYTPTSLITSLLDSALDPVVAETARKPDPEKAILNLKICDPACGSGHFLVAAAHRIARKLASVRTGDEEPNPSEVRRALRDVISRCIYGVDINPMSVELCKVSLWMEAMEPGKPLSFLDHHIQCGNSLIGATPRLLAEGIPNEALNPIEGDSKEICKQYKKENRDYLKNKQKALFVGDQSFLREKLDSLSSAMVQIESVEDDTLEGVKKQQQKYETLICSTDYEYSQLVADAWCAAFVWKKTDMSGHPSPITQELFEKIEHSPHSLSANYQHEIKRLAEQYRFFHWHLAFPDVFHVPKKEETAENLQTGWSGGFDCVLGNPPWERIKLQEKEWFAQRSPDIATAPNADARGHMIEELKENDPAIYHAFLDDKRQSEGKSRLARGSGLYPLCGRGDVNTYTLFAELKRNLLSPFGRVGCIVPSGIATDDTTKLFFQDLMGTGSLVRLYDFENRQKIFPAIDPRIKFCLLTMAGRERPAGSAADFVFFAFDISDLREPERHFTLSANDIALINPNTKTCPIFRGKRDAELTKMIYRRVPVLIREGDPDKDIPEENPWGISFQRMFDMSNDSGIFSTRGQLGNHGYKLAGNRFVGEQKVFLPLYEAKMIHHYDHRWATYKTDGSIRDMTTEEKKNPECLPMPRYWVEDRLVYLRIAKLPKGLLSALRDEDGKRILLGIAQLLFAIKLAQLNGGNVDRAMPALFQNWKDFVKQHPYAAKISPARVGLCNENSPPLSPPDTNCLPDAGLAEIETSPNSETAWYEASSDKVQKLLAMGAFHADYVTDPPQLSQETDVMAYAEALLKNASPEWMMGWRDITNSTNERTVIGSALPLAGVGNNLPIWMANHRDAFFLPTVTSSFACDFASRFKVGGTHLNFFIAQQIPVLTPEAISCKCKWGNIRLSEWLFGRILEETSQSSDAMAWCSFYGYDGPPFKWNEERRFLIRCELDAAFFHLYLGTEDEWCQQGTRELIAYFPTPRDAIEYIMETFPIVKRKDEAEHGIYRTKHTILRFYDDMKQSMETGVPYQTPLDPPPGPPTDAHGNYIPVYQWSPADWPEHIHRS